jgi:hypothetical protein
MDAFARGLKSAAAIRADGRLAELVKSRYASWDSGIGAGKEDFTSLEKHALSQPDPVQHKKRSIGHVADGGLDDDLTQHLVRDYLFHSVGYFVANRLFHKVIVLFSHGLRNSGRKTYWTCGGELPKSPANRRV